jgi:hypothetical protein
MSDEKPEHWLKVLSAGLAVAAFTFAAPIIWQKASHRPIGMAYVDAALRVEDGVLLLMVRNKSDESLDLVEAEIEIDDSTKASGPFGVYPEPSHVYQVTAKTNAQVKQLDGKILVKLKIAQAIEPRKVDQFGMNIIGPAGPLSPAVGSVVGRIKDIKGNVFMVKY